MASKPGLFSWLPIDGHTFRSILKRLPSSQLVRKMAFSDQEFLPHIHSPSSFFSFVSSGKLLTSACNPNVTMIYWLNKWMICNFLYGSPAWALMGWSSHIQKHLRDWYSCIKSAKYRTESGPVNRVTAKETIGMKTKYTSWNIDLTSGGIEIYWFEWYWCYIF